MDIIDEYIKINNSYKKTVVFKIGDEAGFFSEYNNMVLTILYCLENKYRFVLTSKNANFSYEKGWRDFFLPFCNEKNTKFHLSLNHRPYNQKRIYPFYRRVLKRVNLIDNVGTYKPLSFKILKLRSILTQEIFDEARKLELTKKYYYPTLQIEGDLQSACNKICEITWRFNLKTKKKIKSIISSIDLPKEYIGLHIRSGDKFIEQKLFNPSIYFKKIEELTDLRNVFILTDDYRVIKHVKINFKDWNIFTTCKPDERGYFHKDFMKKGKSIIKQEHIKLFSSIEILSKSKFVVGTYSANPGMFLGMKMKPEKFIGIDSSKWNIW